MSTSRVTDRNRSATALALLALAVTLARRALPVCAAGVGCAADARAAQPRTRAVSWSGGAQRSCLLRRRQRLARPVPQASLWRACCCFDTDAATAEDASLVLLAYEQYARGKACITALASWQHACGCLLGWRCCIVHDVDAVVHRGVSWHGQLYRCRTTNCQAGMCSSMFGREARSLSPPSAFRTRSSLQVRRRCRARSLAARPCGRWARFRTRLRLGPATAHLACARAALVWSSGRAHRARTARLRPPSVPQCICGAAPGV